MEIINKYDDKIIVIKTTTGKYKAYAICTDLLGLNEHLAYIGRFKFNENRKEWYFKQSINTILYFRNGNVNSILNYLEVLNKK